jgi:hypothetical protein
MKKNYLHIFVIICFIVSAGLTLGYFWRDTASTPTTDTQPTATPLSTLPSTVPVTSNSGYFDLNQPLQWKQITASETTAVPEDVLAFAVTNNQAVNQFQTGQQYFIADKNAYQNFVPRNPDELVRLQLPSTALTRLTVNSAFVEPIAPWYVPADIPEETRYTVNFQDDYYDTHPAPAGTLITGVFTIWINGW